MFFNLNKQPWSRVAERFGLRGNVPASLHELDALLAAVAAREGGIGRWSIDLSSARRMRT